MRSIFYIYWLVCYKCHMIRNVDKLKTYFIDLYHFILSLIHSVCHPTLFSWHICNYVRYKAIMSHTYESIMDICLLMSFTHKFTSICSCIRSIKETVKSEKSIKTWVEFQYWFWEVERPQIQWPSDDKTCQHLGLI